MLSGFRAAYILCIMLQKQVQTQWAILYLKIQEEKSAINDICTESFTGQ